MPSARTLMFAGFRSRWMMPCSCAASRASAICFAMGSASEIGIAPLAMTLRERWPFDELHDERRRWTGLLEAVDRCDVRMIEGGKQFCFALEPREPLAVARDRHGQHLDRHRALQVRIDGAIHLTHAADADLRGDFVRTEARAGGEGHEWRDYMGEGSGRDRSQQRPQRSNPGRRHRMGP